MSYDLAFWEGPSPRSDAEAMDTFEEIWDALEESEEQVPPTPAIRALVEELEKRWPPFDEASPWASAPLEGDTHGGTLYVNLVFGRPDSDLYFMADTARRLGLVCFDPQLESVL